MVLHKRRGDEMRLERTCSHKGTVARMVDGEWFPEFFFPVGIFVAHAGIDIRFENILASWFIGVIS